MRTLIARLAVLAGLLAVALPVLPAAPALAGNTGPQGASYDLRASEKSSAGQFQIAIGQPAQFTAWVDPVGYTTVGHADTFGELVKSIYGRRSPGDVYLELWYGWSPQCETLGPGDPPTDDGCEPQVLSNPYNGSSTATYWAVTTPTVAPSGTETLFYDFQLYGQSGPGAAPQLLLQSAAGAIVLNSAPPTMAIDAQDPATGKVYPTNAFAVPSGTQVNIQTCITADNCQVGVLDESNFLSDDEYICAVPLSSGFTGQQLYLPGQATQVLTAPDIEYTPPPGQDWTFRFFGFISGDKSLPKGAAEQKPWYCPPLSPSGQPLYLTSIDGQTLADPDPVLEITWQGPTFTPPSVVLTAGLTNPTPGEHVPLTAAYSNPDGAKYLYICAKSLPSGFSVSPGPSPWVAEDALPLSGQEGSGSAWSAPDVEGKVTFLAFLSTDPPSSLHHCPATETVGTYGTRYAGDWSNLVTVTWSSPPVVTLSVTYGGHTWTDTNPPPVPGYTWLLLQGTATNLMRGQNYTLYLCSVTSPQGPLSVGTPWPWADPGTQVSAPWGTDIGQVQETGQATSTVTAGFVAFVSSDPNYPADSGNACPMQPTGAGAGVPGNVLGVSPVVDISWEPPPPEHGGWYPD